MNNQQLNEGLRSLDLENLIEGTVEIDVHKSKMGEDQDVCVLSFTVGDRFPAKDLMEFVERGYGFVLDADISSGENSKGKYNVFIELSRTPQLAENIKELEYGIKRLTGIDTFRFKYYKNPELFDLNEDNIKRIVPDSAKEYEITLNRFKTEDVKQFFDKTLMDDLTLDNDIITIKKPFGNQLRFKQVNEQSISENTIAVDDRSISEIFWLTKVLGDYDITKIGETFSLANKGKIMFLQRI
jgi:hypothetical protein